MADEPPQARALEARWNLAVEVMLGGVAVFFLWATSFGVVGFQYFRGVAVLYSLILSATVASRSDGSWSSST